MATIASRELRNHTASVLDRVADGAVVTITVNGRPVADLIPHRSTRRAFLSAVDLGDILEQHQADAELRADLLRLVGDTTDDLTGS